jgi:hypothetical protein
MTHIDPSLLFRGSARTSNKLRRDTDTLEGRLSHVDRVRIARGWSKVSKHGGLLKHVQRIIRADEKRGWEL